MSTISPRTATFWSEGWTATVLRIPAATRNSSPSRIDRQPWTSSPGGGVRLLHG
jgi:hypothetical protein